MKKKYLNSSILLLLSLCLIFSIALSVSARYPDDFDGSYEDLHCSEDDCDCLEPDSDLYRVVSPCSAENMHDAVVFTGSYQAVCEYYNAIGQTDGLPVTPPTPLKLEKFMRYTPYGDNDVIATVNGYAVTAYQVAVNAVMSGCFAEELPVCIGIVKAMGDTEYLASIADGKLVPMVFVNGPVGRQIGIDHTQGMTTEEVNAALGRFVELALRNLAGIADSRSSSFGSVQPLVLSEDDEACLAAGWQPYHVGQGYDLNDSTVTLTSFSMWGNNVTPATDLPEEIMKIIAWDITEKNLGGLGSADSEAYTNTERTILVTPEVAKALSVLYASKDALEGDLAETARRPMWMRAFAYYYADTDGVRSEGKSFLDVYNTLVDRKEERAELTAAPAWLEGITDPVLMTGACMQPGSTRIFVTGDESRNKTQVMPGGKAVTVKIELSDAWDSLMTSMSYQPLNDYALTAPNGMAAPIAAPSGLPDGTYRILDPASGSKNLKEGRLYYDTAADRLYYNSVNTFLSLDRTENADFIKYIQNLGFNSSFTVDSGRITDAVIRFSSNARKPENNTVALTDEVFRGSLTLHANHRNTNEAGGVAIDGATVILSSSVTSFAVSLDGSLEMGEASDGGFVTINGSAVTVNTNAEAGTTAIIGADNPDGTDRTLTFVMGANNTYTVTYHTSDTLSLTDSVVHLNINGATERFCKTAVCGVYVLTKPLDAGQYNFSVSVGNTAYGSNTAFADYCNRLPLIADGACFMQLNTADYYSFKYDSRSNKLTIVRELTLPEIQSAYLVLNGKIDIAFAVSLPKDYTNPVMTFTGPNGTQVVTKYEEKDDLLHFTYTGITPQCMGDTVTAVLTAERVGETETLDTREYSVRQYCENMLAKTDDDKLITLLSDMLTYGAQAQLYTGYKTNALVTDGVQLSASTYEALSGLAPFFTGTADEAIYWRSAGLTLSDSVAMRLTFCAATVYDLTVKVTVNGRSQTFTEEDFIAADGKENTYQIAFCGINATEFSDAVTAEFLKDGKPLGNTLSYTVNTYICAKQANTSTALADLVKALYNYGASAKNYAESTKD